MTQYNGIDTVPILSKQFLFLIVCMFFLLCFFCFFFKLNIRTIPIEQTHLAGLHSMNRKTYVTEVNQSDSNGLYSMKYLSHQYYYTTVERGTFLEKNLDRLDTMHRKYLRNNIGIHWQLHDNINNKDMITAKLKCIVKE